MNFQKITFENNCVHCHALAFDPNLPPDPTGRDPGLVVPHGRPEEVREFLRALPARYLEYFIRRNNASSAEAQTQMVAAINKLADSYGVAPNNLTQLGPHPGAKNLLQRGAREHGRRRTQPPGNRPRHGQHILPRLRVLPPDHAPTPERDADHHQGRHLRPLAG